MNQPRVAVEGKDDRFVGGEQRVEILVASIREDARCVGCRVMRSTTLITRIFQLGNVPAHQVDCGQRLRVSARHRSRP